MRSYGVRRSRCGHGNVSDRGGPSWLVVARRGEPAATGDSTTLRVLPSDIGSAPRDRFEVQTRWGVSAPHRVSLSVVRVSLWHSLPPFPSQWPASGWSLSCQGTFRLSVGRPGGTGTTARARERN